MTLAINAGDLIDLRRELSTLASLGDVTAAEQNIQSLTTEVILNPNKKGELVTAYAELPTLRAQARRRDEVMLLLEEGERQAEERAHAQRMEAKRVLKQLHASKYELYKQSSERLRNDLRELLNIEIQYGGNITTTPLWNAANERNLYLPAITPYGHSHMDI